MSLNKQVVIRVPLTVTINDTAEAEFIKGLIEMSHDVVNGVEVEPFKKYLVKLAAEKGPEAAMEAVLQSGVTEMLREELHMKSEGRDEEVRHRIAPPTFAWKV